MDHITILTLYSCDAWRATDSMTENSILYQTIDSAMMDAFIADYVRSKNAKFFEVDESEYQDWESCAKEDDTWFELVDNQRIPFLHLVGTDVNLVTCEVGEFSADYRKHI